MQTNESIIAQTKCWILKVVIGCNFCPFAAREMKQGSVHYEVVRTGNKKASLETLAHALDRLDNNGDIETDFLIFPETFGDFYGYLDLVEIYEKFLVKMRYEGIYQLATFHPLYLFAGTSINDAANYTNRSPFPMVQILREASITNALRNYSDPGKIPEQNIKYAYEKGLAYMQALRASCLPEENIR